MTEPTDAELGKLAEECGIGWAAGLGGMSDFLSAFARAVLAKWAAPQQEAQEPALFVSAKQLAALTDPDDPDGEHGRYLPVRKTTKGLFTQALYTAPQPAPQPSHVAQAAVPVYQARYQKGFWQDSSRERNEYLQNPENTCAEDWETRILYTHPPTAQAQWRRPIETAPKDGKRILVHPAIEVADAWSKAHWSAQNECWIVGGSPSGVLHTAWHPLPPAPTSAEGVEHG